MSQKIVWKLDISVVDGPKVSASAEMTVEAYDKLSVDVEAESSKTLEVQPGGAGQVQLLLIKSNHYKKLWYQINSGGNKIKLDSLQLFIGSGAADALGAPLTDLKFENESEEDAVIEILVGRNATKVGDDGNDNGGGGDGSTSSGDGGNGQPSTGSGDSVSSSSDY